MQRVIGYDKNYPVAFALVLKHDNTKYKLNITVINIPVKHGKPYVNVNLQLKQTVIFK